MNEVLEVLTPSDLQEKYGIEYDHTIRIVDGRSPICDEMDDRLNNGVRTSGYWNAWDRTIHCVGVNIPPWYVIAHEVVHFKQMDAAGDVQAWWQRYLDDEDFRVEVECEAYAVDIRAGKHSVESVCWAMNSAIYGYVPPAKVRTCLSKYIVGLKEVV